MGLLDQIANPQQLDIKGYLDIRQQRLDRDEAKRKEIRLGQLVSQAVPGLKEGSVLHTLALEQPREFFAVTKAIGIPTNDGERMQQFADDTNMLYTLAQDDPHKAFDYAVQKRDERAAQGLDTAQMDKFIGGMREDAPRTMTGLFTVHRSLNPQKAQEGYTLGENQSRFDANNNLIASGPKKEDPSKSPKPLGVDDIRQVQKDVSSLIQNTVDVHRAAKSLEALKERGTPLAQTASVFAFMKSLDPTSAVRESEQGQVYDAQGAAAGIAAKLNKMIGEGGLTKAGFQDIVDTSRSLANSSIDASGKQLGDYLTSYGETLPESLKKDLSNRVPKRFESNANAVDQQALDWVNDPANASDPRLSAVKQKLGAK